MRKQKKMLAVAITLLVLWAFNMEMSKMEIPETAESKETEKISRDESTDHLPEDKQRTTRTAGSLYRCRTGRLYSAGLRRTDDAD